MQDIQRGHNVEAEKHSCEESLISRDVRLEWNSLPNRKGIMGVEERRINILDILMILTSS